MGIDTPVVLPGYKLFKPFGQNITESITFLFESSSQSYLLQFAKVVVDIEVKQ